MALNNDVCRHAASFSRRLAHPLRAEHRHRIAGEAVHAERLAA